MISLTSPIRTRAHDWPAGGKLAGLCLTTVLLFVLDQMAIQIAAFLAVLVLYRLPGGRFFREGLRHLRVLIPFVIIILLWHLVTGDPALGLRIALRMVSTVALANLVTMTTSLTALMDVVRRCLTPIRRLGVRTALLETAVPLLIRFVPVLNARAKLLMQSWRARSVRRPGWKIVLPMMLMALDDADRVGEALKARGNISLRQES